MPAQEKRKPIAVLNAVAGPLEGSLLHLWPGVTSLGRGAGNVISILDHSVSPYHCTIEEDGGVFRIKGGDNERMFVNGVPVKRGLLHVGDEIQLGKNVFRFHPDHHRTSVEHEQPKSPHSTAVVVLSRDRVFHSDPRRNGHEFAYSTPMRDWDILQQFTASITSARTVDAVAREALRTALDLADSDWAALLLADESSREFAWTLAIERSTGRERTLALNRAALIEVLEHGTPITGVSGHNASPSGSSFFAAPILDGDRTIGVLYVEGQSEFNDDIQRSVVTVANVVAVALQRSPDYATSIVPPFAEGDLERAMVGNSPGMIEVFQLISRAAPSDSTVLIRGESGTGKELVAQAIHANSNRRTGPFIAINCAAIAETLLESELFGHEKGSFTGAIAQKKGKLELAHGGTVFLDEIGELAPSLQAKLLRVLQEREFERVGGTRSIKLDIRLISATNKDLERGVQHGGFRQDLFYRLNVVSIQMPALRERREDIPLLADFFVKKYAARSKREVSTISLAARTSLMSYDWPGNVRELENAIEHAVVLGRSAVILPEDLPKQVLEKQTGTRVPVTRYHEGMRRAKQLLIRTAMDEAGGQYTQAARLLGLHPNYLHRLMRNLDLKRSHESDD